MRIEIQKIIQPLRLNEYAEQYGETTLQVWVNPARKIMLERFEQVNRGMELDNELDMLRKPGADGLPGEIDILRAREILVEKNEIGAAAIAWMAEILSQGSEETRMSAEELTVFVEDCEESDPGLYQWIWRRVWQMINDYRAQKKKA